MTLGTALVTGASSGIGRAVALALAEKGYDLVLHARDLGRLQAVADAALARGVEARAFVADLESDADIDALITSSSASPLAVLVHSAGFVQLGALETTTADVLDVHYRINVRAAFRLTVGLLPALRAAAGHVVFLNSGAGKRANPGWGAYAASKFALRALADSLRAEVAADGVRVTSVFPGRTATPMQRSVREQEGQPYDADAFVRPEDVAAQIMAALAVKPPGVVTELDVRPI